MPTHSARAAIAELASAAIGGIVTLEAAADALRLDRRAASRRLSALARAGWVTRIRRGVYAIRPLDASPEAVLAAEDAWVIAARVFAPCYLGGWTAAGYWELTEQLFRSTFVVTARHVRRSDVVVGGAAFHLAHGSLRTELKTVWRGGGARVNVSGVERTIVDACRNPAWVGGGRHLAEMFSRAVADGKLGEAELLTELRHTDTGAALGRAGVLTERYWPSAGSVLEYALAHRGTGNVRFDPAVAVRNQLTRRWGVWINVSLPEPKT